MEVAGLVLGAFPAAVLVFEQYKKGARYYANWAQFRRKYEAFIRDLEGQQLFFEGILQDLMCGGPDPFLPSTDSKDKFLEIVNDATFTGWRNPALVSRLKSRLDHRYEWCIYTIKRIYDILEDLRELMNIQELISSEHTADWWKLQWERITQALFVQRYEGHTEAKRLVEELRTMVELSDKQRSQGARIIPSLTPIFRKIWQTSNNLYEALKTAWHCHCHVSHKALLQLEQRLETTNADFQLLFILHSPQNENTNNPASTELVEQEVHIVISEPQNCQNIPVSTSKAAPNSAVTASSIEKIPPKSQLSAPSILPTSSKGSAQSVASASTGKKSIFSLSATALGSKFRKPLRSRKQKGKNPTVTLNQFTILPGIQKQARLDEGPIVNFDKQPQKTIVTPAKHIQTQTTKSPSPPTTPAVPKVLISDLCEAIRASSPDTTLGYLIDRSKNYLELVAGDRILKTSNDAAPISLDQVLEGKIVKPYQFSSEKRAIVATILASSLLQLQRTYWLKSHWTRKDIIFKTRGNTILFDQPYISQDFVSSKIVTETTQTTTPTTPNISKDFNPKTSLESLGILLTELCFGVPIEAHQDRVRVRAMDSSVESNHEFCLAIARAWTWEEIRAQDPLFSDPINNCFNFPGMRRFQEGRADEVMDDIYSLIVRPLYSETVRRWPPQIRTAA